MKKNVFIIAVLCALLGLASCDNRQPDCKYHALTRDLTVMQVDWQWDASNKQFFYHFDLPEVTPYIYNYGNWAICREYNYGKANAYQVALPQTVYYTEQVDSTTIYYSQLIDYAIGVGYVEIVLTNSDYFYDANNPETTHFRLQLIY